MAIFNSYEAVSLDLDLYAFVNKIPVHIATMGLGIPKVLNDRDTVYDGMSVVSQLEARHGFTINNAIVDKIKENEYEYLNLLDDKEVREIIKELPNYDVLKEYDIPTIMYCWSFVDKAAKGFYSFNTVRNKQTGELTHQLIAKPEEPLVDEGHVLPSIECALDMQPVIEGKTTLKLD